MSENETETGAAPGEEIRSNTVLAARREDIELTTEDGLTLVGELALPADSDPVATLVMFHPLPTHGGFMDSHVYRKAALRLPALADLAVLRFNTRGTSSPRGTSEGSFDEGVGERYDVEAALGFAVDRGLPEIWAVGWSFGTELTLKYVSQPENAKLVRGAVLISPPLHRAEDADLRRWAQTGLPLVVIVPEHDDYLQPPEARERFALVPHAQVIEFEGSKHLLVGEKHVKRALETMAAAALGLESVDLPTEVPAGLEG